MNSAFLILSGNLASLGWLLLSLLFAFWQHAGAKLAGISLWLYFTRYFHPLKMNTGILVLAVCYLGCLAAFVFYSVVLVSGTWKSSAEYDKSIWLRHISRIMMLLMLFICYKMIF